MNRRLFLSSALAAPTVAKAAPQVVLATAGKQLALRDSAFSRGLITSSTISSGCIASTKLQFHLNAFGVVFPKIGCGDTIKVSRPARFKEGD